MRVTTAADVLEEAILKTDKQKSNHLIQHLFCSQKLIQVGLMQDESIPDDEMQLTQMEERQTLYHEIKYWLEAFRSIRMEAKAKISIREEIFGRSDYFESIQEEYLKTLRDLERVVNALPNLCSDGEGEKYKNALRIRFIDGDRPLPKAWEKLGYSRSHYFALISKGIEKVQEIYFGDSCREVSKLLLMKIKDTRES